MATTDKDAHAMTHSMGGRLARNAIRCSTFRATPVAWSGRFEANQFIAEIDAFVSGLPTPLMTLHVTVNDGQTGASPCDVKAVIALVGLEIEARIAGAPAMIADGDRTIRFLRDAIRQGVRGIISFGVCGGLDPKLRPGDVVIASSVFAGRDEVYPTDLLWAEELIRMIPRAGYSAIAGVSSPMTSFEERRDFHAVTGAVAADMESQIVARIASELRIPFAVCRVVLNPAHRKLPKAALINIGSAGRPELRKIGRSVVQDPRQLPNLGRLAVDALIALLALRSAKQRLGTHLGFPRLSSQDPVPIPTRALETIGTPA